jgi:hypothetical protein
LLEAVRRHDEDLGLFDVRHDVLRSFFQGMLEERKSAREVPGCDIVGTTP